MPRGLPSLVLLDLITKATRQKLSFVCAVSLISCSRTVIRMHKDSDKKEFNVNMSRTLSWLNKLISNAIDYWFIDWLPSTISRQNRGSIGQALERLDRSRRKTSRTSFYREKKYHAYTECLPKCIATETNIWKCFVTLSLGNETGSINTFQSPRLPLPKVKWFTKSSGLCKSTSRNRVALELVNFEDGGWLGTKVAEDGVRFPNSLAYSRAMSSIIFYVFCTRTSGKIAYLYNWVNIVLF